MLVRQLMLALLLSAAAAQPAAAQQILRDSETEKLFADMSDPLIAAAGLNPRNVKIVLINDPEINAFVAGGQIVYVHTGLVTAADNANQVQGVIAHELGHVAGGHVLRIDAGVKQATGITLLSLVLGGLAMAAGAGEAAMGAMALGQQAALGQFLAFTRAQESSADLAGASYLSKAGVSGRGLIEFFKKLQNQEFRLAVYATDSYDRTHPLSSERVASLNEVFATDPAWARRTEPTLEARFQRVRAKLVGYISDKEAVLRTYPASDTSVPARYARAYAYHRMGDRDAALREADALLAAAPQDPFFLELKGQILLESGKPADALAPLRQAVAKAPDQPMIQSMLGHALLATEKTDKRYSLEGNPKLALASAERAMLGIPAGTPDFLRAQDIAMVSRTAVTKDKKNRRDR
jgi:predicted Zn-dependent protease